MPCRSPPGTAEGSGCCRREPRRAPGARRRWRRAGASGRAAFPLNDEGLRDLRSAAEHVAAERLEAVLAGEAQVLQAVQIFETAQCRVVVVRRVIDATRRDERRDEDGTDAPAAGTPRQRARV